jgi:hypothetical protein
MLASGNYWKTYGYLWVLGKCKNRVIASASVATARKHGGYAERRSLRAVASYLAMTQGRSMGIYGCFSYPYFLFIPITLLIQKYEK